VSSDGVVETPVDVEALGLGGAPLGALAGGTPEENAAIVEAVLRGEPGPRRDAVLLNAGAAFLAAGRVPDLAEGVERARGTLDAGTPRDLLESLRAERQAAEAAPTVEAAPA
jgi:anthranilate phosphoribosyltransferase